MLSDHYLELPIITASNITEDEHWQPNLQNKNKYLYIQYAITLFSYYSLSMIILCKSWSVPSNPNYISSKSNLYIMRINIYCDFDCCVIAIIFYWPISGVVRCRYSPLFEYRCESPLYYDHNRSTRSRSPCLWRWGDLGQDWSSRTPFSEAKNCFLQKNILRFPPQGQIK